MTASDGTFVERVCVRSGEPFSISPREQELCRRDDIPLPTLAPHERLREILNFRASPRLHYGTCAVSQRKIVTVVPPDSPYRIYDAELGDVLNAEQYGRDYDFREPFFWQFINLGREVPYPARIVLRGSNENCEFNHGIHQSKDCYLCFRTISGVDSLYSRYIRIGTNIVDSMWCVESEICYACTNIVRCYQIFFSHHCQGCSESAFLYDCVGCKNCFCCVGLRGREYCFENEQLTETEYRTRIATIDLASRAVCRAMESRLNGMLGSSARTLFLESCEDSTGNHLVNTCRAESCYLSHNAEDIEHCIGVERIKSSLFQVGMGVQSELLYNNEAVGNQAYHVAFCVQCFGSIQDLEYCWNCSSGCSYCFGCVGLRRASYCILNKQYSKTEYFETVARIKAQMRVRGEYGSFFPSVVAPCPFNFTEANDFLPLEREVALARGYRWADDDDVAATAGGEVMPDHLDDLPEDALSRRYRCQETTKLYTLQKQEHAFHLRYRIALPDTAPLARIAKRAQFLKIQ